MTTLINLNDYDNHCHPRSRKHNHSLMGDYWDVSEVASSIAIVRLIRAEPNRSYPGVNITNNATTTLWLTVGATLPVLGYPCVDISPGSNIDIPTTGLIYGIWEGTALLPPTGKARIIEFLST